MKTLLTVTLAMWLVGAAVASDQDETKHSVGAANHAKQQQQAILAEIKTLETHEWAGDYYAGDGLGVNNSLIIAPRAGYVFMWQGCMGLYDLNYGAVEWADGRLRLSFTFENQREGFQGIAPVFVPVSWGARRYLIPADDIIGFCNHINEGEEPRKGGHGAYLLRQGDESKPVTGLPGVPAEYRGYLLAKPIEASIVATGPTTNRPSIADWKFRDTPVTIDAGKQQGLRTEMTFFVTNPRHTVESIRVTKVEETRSEGIMTQSGEDDPGPQTGWRLSTRAPWSSR